MLIAFFYAKRFSIQPEKGISTSPYIQKSGARNKHLVHISLNEINFEAKTFETRSMPTPDMKGKEMIYWIKVETSDKRLVTELQRFLSSSSQYIELQVRSAFILAKTELESYRIQRMLPPLTSKETNTPANTQGHESEEKYNVEIILRRPVLETNSKQSQAPYG